MSNMIFIFSAAVIIFFGFVLGLFYRKLLRLISDISYKYENLERLLLDIRDGTRKFYKEKRRYLRIRDGISARLDRKDTPELIKVIDISYGGALLKTKYNFKPRDIINLSIYLPLFPQPIDVKAKVARVLPVVSEDQQHEFNVGIEFIEMTDSDREKLVETVDAMRKERLR